MKQASKSKLEALNALTNETVALFHRLRAVADEVHEKSAVTAGMRGVLISLQRNGPQTVPQMARARPVSRQHIQTIVNSLREQGLVELLDNPAHKRSSLVRLTNDGHKTLARMKKQEDQLLSQAVIPVSKKELRAAAQTLQSVRGLFEGPEWRLLTHLGD